MSRDAAGAALCRRRLDALLGTIGRRVDPRWGPRAKARAALLLNLGLDACITDLLARYKFRCLCGAPAVAVGVFWSTPPGECYRNAMYLCEACAKEVDAGVEVHYVVDGVVR